MDVVANFHFIFCSLLIVKFGFGVLAYRAMNILSRRSLRKLLTVIRGALHCRQLQWLMRTEQWHILN